jgi:hypothetical protein
MKRKKLMFTHPITKGEIYEGDIVRKYLYNKSGERDGLSKPYEVVVFRDPILYALKEARYLDYVDTVGDDGQMVVCEQNPEEVEYIAFEKDDMIEFNKMFNSYDGDI